jgi:hypothetical protein
MVQSGDRQTKRITITVLKVSPSTCQAMHPGDFTQVAPGTSR